ncbi:MAG: hypothetical protein LBI28_10460 [Treponema sp.]|jgi:hypothetical protein|nr:hypothetical protein [Treponema sp.]
MKTLGKNLLLLFIAILLLSCNRSANDKKEQTAEPHITVNEDISNNNAANERISGNNPAIGSSLPMANEAEENDDFFTDYYWSISDGRWIEDRSVYPYIYNWVGPQTPHAIFRKLEIPSECILYQYRLRRERFSLVYQTEKADKLYKMADTLSDNLLYIYDVEFRNGFSILNLRTTGTGLQFSMQDRVGERSNPEYPLLGIWGSLPYLTEYRLVDPTDCLYYMEIDKEIPFWAVRRGTYLLRQIEDNIYETVSSFPDGRLRLEVQSDTYGRVWILLRPLFTLPDDEEGLVGLLVINRGSKRSNEYINEYLE